MPFTHKLSRRLSLLRDAMLFVAVASVSACTDGSPLGNEFGPSAGTDSPANPSQIVGMLATSDNPTVEPEQSTRLRVVAIRADGLRQPVEAEWEAIDGGELRDTVVDGKTFTSFRAKEPGDYRLVSYDRGKKFRDTTRVTVPQGNSVSIAKLYLVPAVVSLVAGQGQQFFVYGTTAAGDSVPLVASLSTAEGGVASGLYYTAGTTPGSYQVIASRHGGPETDTALVSIQAADTPPASAPTTDEPAPTDPISDPVPTDPAPYQPPTTEPSTSRAPELPRVYLDTRFVAPTGRTIVVPAGGSLQEALNAAARGDVVELAAGATYTGNFVLPQKSGTGWVTIRTATALPPEGTRITPQAAASFAKIRTPNAMPAIRTAAGGGASYYRLMGLDVGSTATMTYALMHIGDYDNTATSVDMLPTHIYLDRMYVHGAGTQGIQRCIVLNSRHSAVVDSWLAECRIKGFDSQAIVGWNGPGPFKIVNNRLEGAGENLMFGGADPRILNLTPSDIEIRRNHIIKPLEWKASGAWTVKNLFELKNAMRVLIEDNVLENNWTDAQTGFAVVLKTQNQSGRCDWCITADITWRHNKIINSPGGFNIMPNQAGQTGEYGLPMERISITETVLEDVGLKTQPGTQRMFQLLGNVTDLVIAHNTGFGENVILMFDGAPGSEFVFKNNLLTRGQYGIFGSGKGEGKSALAYYAPTATVAGNVLVGAPPTLYPAGNYFPTGTLAVGMTNYAGGDYSLLSTSPYATAGTDGSTPGADVAELRQRLEGVK